MESNSTMTVEIHEFSTGIKAERTAGGGWISRGFTGQYMNSTLTSIPDTVSRAIANRLFAVVEGTSNSQPAVIGRVVPGERDFSVVAVVSRGRDDGGRPLSVYRYFLCKGADGLWKILAWMEQYKKKEGHLPMFNPFEREESHSKVIFSQQKVNPSQFERELRSFSQSPPIIISWERPCTPIVINAMADTLQGMYGKQPVSWAYNAKALETPWNFILIFPASERAYHSFVQAKTNQPLALMPATIDEQALKSVIKSLINSSQAKPEAVLKIAEASMNEQITSEYWHRLLDAQGARKALEQDLYSPQLVRLITLRAMMIPETLPKFLEWLKIDGNRQKNDRNQDISLKFQQALASQFNKVKLASGIQLLLPKLLNKEISPEAIRWLLKAKDSAWTSCYQMFIQNIEADLDKISTIDRSSPHQSSQSHSNAFCCGDRVWRELSQYYQVSRSYYNEYKPDYKPLAKLFEKLKKYNLSAYFYQVSLGHVPKKIFDIAFQKPSESVIFNLRCQRKLSPVEFFLHLFTNASQILSSNLIYIGGFVIVLLYLGYFSSIILDVVQRQPYIEGVDSPTKSKEEIIKKASKRSSFAQTIQSLEDLTRSLVQMSHQSPTKEFSDVQIQNAIVRAICLEDLLCLNSDFIDNSNGVISKINLFFDRENKKKWTQKIYEYQKHKNLEVNGIVTLDSSTYQSLKQDVKSSLGIGLDPILLEGLKRFGTTVQSIKSIVQELQKDLTDFTPEEIITEIKITLGNPNLEYHEAITIWSEGDITSSMTLSQKKWVNAIYQYQTKKNQTKKNQTKKSLPQDGVIDLPTSSENSSESFNKNNSTYMHLKDEVKRNLVKRNSPTSQNLY